MKNSKEIILKRIQSALRKENRVKTSLWGLKSEFPGMKSELPGLKPELPGLKPELPGLKPELPGLKPELPGLKSELPGMKPSGRGIETKIPGMESPLRETEPQFRGMEPQVPGMESPLRETGPQFSGIDRKYETHSKLSQEERIRLFIERVSDYNAQISEADERELPKVIAEICAGEKVKKLVVPPGIEDHWLPEKSSGVELMGDDPEPLSIRELDQSDAVLTGCFRAVAQTGTIVMTGGAGQGRRLLTLLPDFHICVVRRGQVVGIIPEVFWELDPFIREKKGPVTFISGPSATSDIELDRVEGVHGPRRLHVVVV